MRLPFSTYILCILPLLLLLSGCQSMVRFATRADTEQQQGGSVLVYGAADATTRSEQRVVEEAENWLGTPYLYAGTTRDGIDCSALMVHVFNKLDVQLPRTSTEQFATGKRVEFGDLLVGDLVFFDINGGGVSHVGVYVGGNAFIHASSSSGVVRESLAQSYYARRFAGARRVLRQ